MIKNRIHFLNTIWSDSILLESSGHFALLDTGSKFYYPMIKAYLEKLNIKELDFAFISHFHNDHYGCLPLLLDDFKIKTVYLRAYSGHDGSTGDGTKSTKEYHETEYNTFLSIKEKASRLSSLVMIDENLKSLNFYDFNFDIFGNYENIVRIYNDENSPFYQIDRFNENYDCVSLFTKLNGKNVYLGCDITDCDNPEYEDLNRLNRKAVLEIYKKYNIDKIDLYKVAHHGVHDSNSAETLNLIKCDYAVITNTDRWLRNYPTISSLVEANKKVKILRTDWQKQIFEFSEDGKMTYYSLTDETLFDE